MSAKPFNWLYAAKLLHFSGLCKKKLKNINFADKIVKSIPYLHTGRI